MSVRGKEHVLVFTKTRDMPELRSWDPDPDGSLNFELPNWRFIWFHFSAPYR